MDKGTQHRKPSYFISAEQRKQYVLNFIEARLRGSVKLNSSFGRNLARYLSSSGITPLRPMKLTYVTFTEAEEYLDYLVAIVTGSQQASADILQNAIDQLFAMIFAMRDYIKTEERISDSPDWKTQLASVQTRLDALEKSHRRLDERLEMEIKKIADALDRIEDWRREYQPTLDEAKREYIGRARRTMRT